MFKVLDYIIDFVFIFDVILSFFTSVINKKGIESFDQSEIFDDYTQ